MIIKETQVQSIETREVARKDGKGTFEALDLLTNDGLLLSGYVNQESKDLKVGDLVEVVYTTHVKQDNTSFNKLRKLTKLNAANPGAK